MLQFLGALLPRFGLSAMIGPAGAVVSAGASVLQAAVAFFSTPLGKYVGIGLFGLGLFVAGEVHRGHADAALWAQQQAGAEQAARARDAAIAKQVSADADARIASISQFADQLQAQVTAYEKAAGSAACRANAADVKRLRGL